MKSLFHLPGRRRHPIPTQKHPVRPLPRPTLIEALEQRISPATFIVNSVGGTGTGSREMRYVKSSMKLAELSGVLHPGAFHGRITPKPGQ